MKLWAKLSSIISLLVGIDLGWNQVRQMINNSMEQLGYFVYDLPSVLLLLAGFMIYFLPVVLISVPLWYYGWRKE